jgi:hypothetical protein
MGHVTGIRPLGWLLVGSVVASGGCLTLAADAARNLCHEKAIKSGEAEARRNGRREAQRALAAVMAADPHAAYPAAYAEGFCDGYVDYVVEGGPGNPPPLPPACDPHVAADWFAGFRHGTDAARADNARRDRLIPVLVTAGPAATTQPTNGPALEAPAGNELLPPPRPER